MIGKLLFVCLALLVVTQMSTARKNSGNNFGSNGQNGQNGQVIEEKTVIVTKTQEAGSGYGNGQNFQGYGQNNQGYGSKSL